MTKIQMNIDNSEIDVDLETVAPVTIREAYTGVRFLPDEGGDQPTYLIVSLRDGGLELLYGIKDGGEMHVSFRNGEMQLLKGQRLRAIFESDGLVTVRPN